MAEGRSAAIAAAEAGSGGQGRQDTSLSRSPPGLGESTAFTNVALEEEEGDDSGSDLDQQEAEERQKRRQEMETDQLDPKEKAAHEADTLPVGAGATGDAGGGGAEGAKGAQGGGEERAGIIGSIFGMVRSMKRLFLDGVDWTASRIMTSRNALPPDPSRSDLVKHSLRCPPHGHLARYLSLSLLPLVLWLACFSALGPVAAPPNGTIFLLLVLVVVAVLVGKVFGLARLPPLLGMLLTGIVMRNLPGITFQEDWSAWASSLRSLALTVILMRAGLGLDPQALRRLSITVFLLAFCPCLVETFVVGVASNLILGFPWLWGFLLGFILAAVSPAVVVPCLLQLQERGYGVAKGIPTLVIAAASVDDVLAISGFTILLGITFDPNLNLAAALLRGPAEALVGLLVGIAWGALVSILPGKDDPHFSTLRFVFLFGGGIAALFGSKMVHLPGSGPLAVLVMAFTAGVGWRRQGWTNENNVVAKHLSKLWILFQPILFGLIGTEIDMGTLDGSTVGLGVVVLVIGLTIRIIVSFFAVSCSDLNLKERLFVALAWLPKATVQAAIGPVALDQAKSMNEPDPEKLDLGLKVLTIAVLVILITAPIGAIAIMLSAPRLLEKGDSGGSSGGQGREAGAAAAEEGASLKSQQST